MKIKKNKLKKGALIFAALLLSVAMLLALGIVGAFVYARKTVNYEADELLFASAADGSVIRLYADSNPSDAVYTPVEVECIYPREGKMEWVKYEDIPPRVIDCFLAMEDRSFFSHKGVSLARTAKAAVNYLLFSRGGSFGGSTVTQQVIKNVSGDSARTVRRKLTEMLRAYHIEQTHSKEEILEVYLNILPMGENICGIDLAAERYFGKKLSSLEDDEIAVLVGIANAPGRYNPHENPEACLQKRNRVLFAMRETGVIGEAAYRELCERSLCVLSAQERSSDVHSWFAETVLEEIREDLCRNKKMSPAAAEALLSKGGLSVYTTMDPAVQKTLEQAFSNMQGLPKECENGLQGAMVVVDAESGQLRGIVGRMGEKNANYLLNHALVSHVPGSALKPLALYAPLIDAGRIHAATVMDDVPVSFTKSGATLREYPKNYPAVYSGLITVKDALRLSKNTVALRLYEMLGAERIYRLLSGSLDLDTLVRSAEGENGEKITDLSAAPLALGQLSYGVPLRSLTEAYGVFAGEGVYRSGQSYLFVEDGEGRTIIKKESRAERVFSAEGARLMNQLLSEVVESGTAKSIRLSSLVDTAGKTGTSGEDRDRVFVGYTPYYVAGIWMGYESGNASIGRVAPTHLAIWDGVMRALHERRFSSLPEEAIRSFSREGLVRASYCKDSGCACGGFCHMDLRGEREESFYFLKSCRPAGICRTHIPVYYDMEKECVATEQTLPENLSIVSMLRIEARDFPKPIFVSDQKYVYAAPEGENAPSPPLFPFSLRRRKHSA